MKNYFVSVLISLFLLSFFSLNAQVKKLTASAFQRDVENIILDYPNNFRHYIGEEWVKNPQSVDYTSLLKIRGSEECYITKYPSAKKDFYSFQSILLTTDEFETAKSAFHNFYRQLSGLSIRFSSQTLHLKSDYEEPDDSKKFASIIFTTDGDGDFSKRLKVELLLENVLLEWKIKLLVYEKEREDDEPSVLSSK